MVLAIDSSLLLSALQARAGVSLSGAGASGATGGSAPKAKVAPTAPWNNNQVTAASDAVKAALAGRKFINEGAAQLDLPGASTDYRKLFALYQGLNTLLSVGEQMNAKGLVALDRTRLQQVFAKGLSEVDGYVEQTGFDQLRMTQGAAAALAKTTLTVPKAGTQYVTPPLANSSSDPVAAFGGNVEFTISIKRLNITHDVDINLADMGAQPRTFNNVLAYINQQLQAQGLETRFGTQRSPGQPRVVEAGGQKITLPATSDQWALKVVPGTGETVSFSAPATAGSVYVAQSVGDPNPDDKASTDDDATSRQLLKFQTDATAVDAPVQGAGETNWVDGRVFAKDLGPEVKAVRATKVGPDGSVYVLADVVNTTAGQPIKGDRDVALLKYDSAGKLLYTRTLGAADSASGLGLAVAADGKVAVAGSLKGVLNGAQDGPINSGPTGTFADAADSFVTLYDAEGQEVWTQRRGARQDDEASQVAFGADGTVYVAGRAKSTMPGATAIGGWDSYLEAFNPTPNALGKVQTLFTQTFGTAGSDRPAGMVVDGNALVTASVEDGHAVLRRFDLSGGMPVLAATRDLGDLQGGDLAGLALDGGRVVLAGSTANSALAAGTVTRAKAGGVDAFAATLSADLTADPGDAIAYYGGAGDDRATSLAVSGGKVWIGGSAGVNDIPGAEGDPAQAPVGERDGFLASLDVAQGQVDWTRRFTGKAGQAAPTAIAVDDSGSSVLDRLGLPKGTLDLSDSQRLTAVSAIRPGDSFTVRVGSGVSKAVTIEAADTLDTLAQKVRRASGFQAKVSIVTLNGARQLKIEPLNPRMTVEIGPGKLNQDALETLGLPAGVVRATEVVDGKTVPADGKGTIYGLGLDYDLNLDDAGAVSHALAKVSAAMTVVRTAYKDLVAAASPKPAQATAAAGAKGPVPAYLTNQIANYQAALARLTGGSS